MAKLTQRRLEKATDILEKYRRRLHAAGRLDTQSFEKELRECWNIGYQELKDIVIGLSKIHRYRFVAAYYMEHVYPCGPPVEFEPRLAELYGISSYLYSKAKAEKREAFWSGLQNETESEV